MIRLNGVSYTYQDSTQAVHEVDLTLQEGGVHLLAGTNGSGKSTLLSLLAGLVQPSSGRALVGQASGEDIRDVSRLVLQDADLQLLGATVGEDVMLGRETRPQAEEEARLFLRSFDLESCWGRPVHTLSGGMKRKLCLATALLDAPQVLLLDEPFSGLDYPAILELRRIVRDNKRKGMTQVLAVHDLEPVIDLADTLSVLSQGGLALHGKPEHVLDHVRRFGVRPPAAWQAGLGIVAWDGKQ